jgi:hypothetical protein
MENKTRKIQKREQYSRKGRVNKEQVSPGLFFFFFYRGNCREERTSLVGFGLLVCKEEYFFLSLCSEGKVLLLVEQFLEL